MLANCPPELCNIRNTNHIETALVSTFSLNHAQMITKSTYCLVGYPKIGLAYFSQIDKLTILFFFVGAGEIMK
jgi:hypothetical protein